MSFIKLAIKNYTLHNCLTTGFEWHVRLQISHCTHHTTVCCLLMYVQHVSIPIWRVANIVPMLQVRNFESNSTIPRPLMWGGHGCSRTYLLQVNLLLSLEDGAHTTHIWVCLSVCVSTALRHHRL